MTYAEGGWAHPAVIIFYVLVFVAGPALAVYLGWYSRR